MPATVSELFDSATTNYADRTAYLHKAGSEWATTSYSELRHQVRELGAGLAALGIQKGDRVAILSNSRPEWSIADFAIIGLGAIVVPIYQTSSPAEVRYVLENSGARALILEDAAQHDRIAPAMDGFDQLEWTIAMDATGTPDSVSSMADIAAGATDESRSTWDSALKAATPDDMLTYIYTSGTTGPPKGCMLTQGNYGSMVDMVVRSSTELFRGDDRIVLFLPLAHTFARLIHFLAPHQGMELVFSNPVTVLDDLAETSPTLLPAVPRVFEKAYNKVQARLGEATGPRKALAGWALKVGNLRGKYVQAGRRVPPLLALQWIIAYTLVFKKIHASFGGRVRFAVSGGAPLSREIHEFFLTAGLIILEGYGLTESTTALTLSLPDKFHTGSVGPALPGCELRIAEDGEILARGPHVFQGYYGNAEETAEVVEDGWLHTGDIGHIEDGMLYITDRKKDIIVTAGGKNVAPQLLENGMKAQPLISQALVYGDQRPFLSALVTIDPDDAAALAAEHGLPTDMVDLIATDAVLEHVQASIDKVNGEFGRAHQVRKFRVLPIDFTTESGELTASLKLKRKIVNERYIDYIEQMYEDGAADAGAIADPKLVERHAGWVTSQREGDPVSAS